MNNKQITITNTINTKKSKNGASIIEFIDKHENDRKNISEKDQFHMIMQLIELAYQTEFDKFNVEEKNDPEFVYIVNCKWKLIKKHVKNLWEITLFDKYNVVMEKITAILDIWNIDKICVLVKEYDV